jgi:acetyl-CoA carboxylase biotin carboxyl carrier protein
MKRKRLEELIRLVEESDIQELSVTGPMNSVRIVKSGGHVVAHDSPHAAQSAPVREAAPPPAAAAAAEPAGAEDDRDSGLVPVASPMVGTFYSAPAPESPPYVRQGDHVNKGQVVCIVEAMKLMNEIESEVSGTIVRVLVENADPVEFGQHLFLVEPD